MRRRPKILIRELRGPRALGAVEGLQRRVWGRDERTIAGRNLLTAAQTAGGLIAGAFVWSRRGERLAGFSYGFWARRGGIPVFWSHMLGVLPRYRSLGVGAALKRWQRRWARRCGARSIEWTFDPLRALNAHFNLEKLGATSGEYLVDHYGPMRDALNGGLPTDRLVASWKTSPARRARPPALAKIPPTLDWRRAASQPHPLAERPAGRPAWTRVAVPSDLSALKRASLRTARRWRLAVRKALVGGIRAGYRVEGFRAGRPVGWYLLRRR